MNKDTSFDINKIRGDFPMLQQTVYNKPFVYFDNGATAQKPKFVIDFITNYYSSMNSNIHRGVHFYSEKSTSEYEEARKGIQNFINAQNTHEIIFTKGTTESINLVAFSFGEKYIHEGDEIVISEMEHHSNIVPWQMLCERKNARLKIIPFDDKGELKLDEYENLLSEKTKLVAVTHISNSLGTINPVKKIIEIAHKKNIPILIDGAQGILHEKVDVQELDCDFYVFSGHKLYGPTGIGILYGKEKWLEAIPPYQTGGDMVDRVTFEKTTFAELPLKFEAGTTPFVEALAMKKAIDYLQTIGFENIIRYETELLQYAQNQLQKFEDLTIYGNAQNKASVISFLLKGIHHYDTGMILDKLGIAVRTGTHCTQPVMEHFNIDGTVRASMAFYNTFDEVDLLCRSLEKVKSMFA